MSWAEELPMIHAENEAWRAKHGPALRERDNRQAAEREQVRRLIERGLEAIEATEGERALVFTKTGFIA